MRSPVDSRVAPARPRRRPRSSATVRAEPRLVEHRRRREDRDPGAHRERERVGRPRVDLDRVAVALEEEPGVERLVGEVAR